jgi:hypothetical protein
MARNPEVQRRVFREWYAVNRGAVLAKQKEWRDSERGQAHRWRRTLAKYDLTQSAFDSIWEAQDGKCAGCLATLVLGPGTHIDHCHGSNVVRGLLCASCNLALGKVMDAPETLRRLASYLDKASEVRCG